MNRIEFRLVIEYFNNFVSDSLEGIQNTNTSQNHNAYLCSIEIVAGLILVVVIIIFATLVKYSWEYSENSLSIIKIK